MEVGCGTGNVSCFLSAKGYEVTGCEYHRTAMEISYENSTKTRGDAFSLPFREHN
ncbi:MAG: methyltransferase domain-containing protein [Nitrospirae bacterium]|nr:methyltransferase domain-containing protein [Nitrospirota bacterium]